MPDARHREPLESAYDRRATATTGAPRAAGGGDLVDQGGVTRIHSACIDDDRDRRRDGLKGAETDVHVRYAMRTPLRRRSPRSEVVK